MVHRILIIEDERQIARVLELELAHEGYEVSLAADGEDGLAQALAGDWSCILLDLQLPGLSGFQVLEQIRKEKEGVPILIMTAREQVRDKVRGLDQGANDYVTKPFEYEELSARIRALIRAGKWSAIAREHQGSAAGEEEQLQVDALTAHTRTREVQREGKPIELTPREFDLLVYMLRHKGEPLGRDKILAEVWGFAFAGQTNLVDVYISYLRQKIDQGYKKKLIVTSRGVGYSIREPEA
ncbi:MAG: PhoB family transcriptional regulator [Paenibacillaceae bacterium]|nr:PhoB family transcriptional regulator [Paenibacillaceae bacterium]